MTDLPSAEEQQVQWVGGLLRTGVVLSAAVMVAGIVALLAGSTGAMDEGLRRTAAQLLNDLLDPASEQTPLAVLLLYAGLVLLMLTPVLRVLTVAVTFALEKDRRFAFLSLVVLIMLIAEIVFALS